MLYRPWVWVIIKTIFRLEDPAQKMKANPGLAGKINNMSLVNPSDMPFFGPNYLSRYPSLMVDLEYAKANEQEIETSS